MAKHKPDFNKGGDQNFVGTTRFEPSRTNNIDETTQSKTLNQTNLSR